MKPNTKNTTQTQIFGLHAHHKPRNQHRNTTLPQTHKPKNQHTPQIHKPRSTKLTTHKPTVGIHISTTICTTELRDREMKEPFGFQMKEPRSAPPNRWLGFRTTKPYRIGDYGELPNRWTFTMGFLSLTAAVTSLSLERVATSSLRFERVWVRLEFGSWWRWDFERVWVWERFRRGWREKEKIRDRESLEMRLKEKEKELRLKKIWFDMRFGKLIFVFVFVFSLDFF